MNRTATVCPLALFRQMLLEFQQDGYSRPEKEAIFLENLRLNFQMVSLPSRETIESYFILSYESRPFAFKTKWINEEIIVLIWAVFHMSEKKGISVETMSEADWQKIALLFQDRTSKQCMFKYFNLLRSNPIKKENKWTAEEDQKLLEIANTYIERKIKFKWTRIANELFEHNGKEKIRMGKHCRERWNNHLNPKLNKGKWTAQEDLILLKNVGLKGRKWAKISRLLQGRNEYAVKNRFYFLMKKYHLNPNSKTLCQDVRQFVKNTWKIPMSSKPMARLPRKTNGFAAKNSQIPAEEEKTGEIPEETEDFPNEFNSSQVKVEATPVEIKQETKENPLLLRNSGEIRNENEGPQTFMANFEENERKKREMQQMMLQYWSFAQRSNNMMLAMNNPLNFMAMRQQQMQMAWNRQMMEKMAFLQRNSMNFGLF